MPPPSAPPRRRALGGAHGPAGLARDAEASTFRIIINGTCDNLCQHIPYHVYIIMCPPLPWEGGVAAAPLLRSYGFRLLSRIQSRLESRTQSRIQTPRSQARIDAPNGWGWGGVRAYRSSPETARRMVQSHTLRQGPAVGPQPNILSSLTLYTLSTIMISSLLMDCAGLRLGWAESILGLQLACGWVCSGVG